MFLPVYLYSDSSPSIPKPSPVVGLPEASYHLRSEYSLPSGPVTVALYWVLPLLLGPLAIVIVAVTSLVSPPTVHLNVAVAESLLAHDQVGDAHLCSCFEVFSPVLASTVIVSVYSFLSYVTDAT